MTEFIWPIRIYYEDTDAGGLVYHANYLNFLERARTEMLRASGIEQTELKISKQVIFAVRSVKVDYLKPAVFNDLLEVKTQITLIKNVSLTFKQVITRNEVILCKAEVYVACLDSVTMRPKLIPEDLIAQLQ
jgi:acyl-CoA thioester hydrolase